MSTLGRAALRAPGAAVTSRAGGQAPGGADSAGNAALAFFLKRLQPGGRCLQRVGAGVGPNKRCKRQQRPAPAPRSYTHTTAIWPHQNSWWWMQAYA